MAKTQEKRYPGVVGIFAVIFGTIFFILSAWVYYLADLSGVFSAKLSGEAMSGFHILARSFVISLLASNLLLVLFGAKLSFATGKNPTYTAFGLSILCLSAYILSTIQALILVAAFFFSIC
jgi:hypothetical protein